MGTSRLLASYPPRRNTSRNLACARGSASRLVDTVIGSSTPSFSRSRRFIGGPPSAVHEFGRREQERVPLLRGLRLIERLLRGAVQPVPGRLVIKCVGKLREGRLLDGVGRVRLEQSGAV